MKRNKIYILFALLGFAALIICFVVGALNNLNWLIFLGFGLCGADFLAVGIAYSVKFFRELNAELEKSSKEERTPEREVELIKKVNAATDREESLKAQAEYYGDGAKNAGELSASSFGFSKEGKKAFKNASRRDKAKVILLFIWLWLTLAVFFVGVVLANLRVQPAGFILLGVGGGLFFITIAAALIISIAERRAYFISGKQTEKPSERVVRTGVVKRCELHSQVISGDVTPKIGGTLYQIWVWTSDKEPLVRLVCSKKYQKYDKVRFYESRGLRPKRRIIEKQSDDDK